MGRRERRQAARRLLELRGARARTSRYVRVVPGDHDVDEPLEEVALTRLGGPPRLLEGLVSREVVPPTRKLDASPVRPFDHRATVAALPPGRLSTGVATILVAGVDVFFRGKLDGLLAAEHKLTTTESVDPPDLVIVDIARVDPEEVAEEYPDIPILGFTNHTDTAGLRAAHAAGFDRVVVRSALAERAPEIVHELVP